MPLGRLFSPFLQISLPGHSDSCQSSPDFWVPVKAQEVIALLTVWGGEASRHLRISVAKSAQHFRKEDIGGLGQLVVPKTPTSSFSNQCRQTCLATEILIITLKLLSTEFQKAMAVLLCGHGHSKVLPEDWAGKLSPAKKLQKGFHKSKGSRNLRLPWKSATIILYMS